MREGLGEGEREGGEIPDVEVDALTDSEPKG